MTDESAAYVESIGWTREEGSSLLTISVRIPDGNSTVRNAASDLVRFSDELSVSSFKARSLYVFVDPQKGLENMRRKAEEDGDERHEGPHLHQIRVPRPVVADDAPG